MYHKIKNVKIYAMILQWRCIYMLCHVYTSIEWLRSSQRVSLYPGRRRKMCSDSWHSMDKNVHLFKTMWKEQKLRLNNVAAAALFAPLCAEQCWEKLHARWQGSTASTKREINRTKPDIIAFPYKI